MNRLALLDQTADIVTRHLVARAPLEEGAFCLLREGKGTVGSRLLATEPLLPPPGAWERQGPDELRPSAQWLSAAIGRAIEAGAGLLFIHSHPSAHFPHGLSPTDRSAFQALASVLAPMLDGPFAAAVVHPDGWYAQVWSGDRLILIDRVLSVGRTLRFLSPVLVAESTPLDLRQRDALGVAHDRLRQLAVAVVGCGGTGSPVAEQLVRMGVAEVVLVDPDQLDTASNVRRIFGSVAADLGAAVPLAKVDVVGRHLEQLGLGVRVRRINKDVRTEAGFRPLLDADVVFSATDTHSSRAVINELASTYLLPVIDVGVRAGSKANGMLSGLLAEVRILTPSTPCLWCRRTIDGHVIRAENLPENERRELEREGYVVDGIGDPEPSVVALTVLGSGLGTCALLALLSDEGEAAPSAYWVDGFLGDAHETEPGQPLAHCRCRTQIGLGDSAAPPLLDATNL